MSDNYELCPKCKKNILYTCDEIDDGFCNNCADKLIEQSNETRDWNYYHE